jgi:hypothetical protein
MRKLLIAGFAALGLSACETPQQTGALIGAGTGAAIGGVATDSVGGAVAGGIAGAAVGAIIGHVADRPGHCYARDRFGRTVVVRC